MSRGSRDGEVDGDIQGLIPLHGESIVRIVQEAYSNVAKHGKPGSRVRRRVGLDEGRVLIEVVSELPAPKRGSGKNIRAHTSRNEREQQHSTNYGVLGIHERARLLSGTAEVAPSGQTWVVRVSWPYRISDSGL